MLYQDNLIEINNDSIILKHYYFPFIPTKVLFKNIKTIEIVDCNFINGAWKLWGSGNFTIWFPIDILRPRRDEIFIITYKNQKIKSGFTVDDSEKVENIFKEKEWLGNIFS